MNRFRSQVARLLDTRRGRRIVKLFVVTGGLIWCGSVPGLVGAPHARVPEARLPRAPVVHAAIAPPVQLALLPPDEAASRVRELLSRRAPGDLDLARTMLDEALAAAPPERERRRGLERLRSALRRLEREEARLAGPLSAYAMKADVDGVSKDLPGPLPVHTHR